MVVAIILAVISAFYNHPGKEYLGFIDFRVLGILLSLMLVMAGLQLNGIFKKLGEMLIGRCDNTRRLAQALIFMCFVSSMLLTNDVALITFVPFALLTLKMSKKEYLIIPTVVLQTLGANLGSMLTPMGNPQNLYLYGISGMDIGRFIMLMLPYTVVSAILLWICTFFIKRENLVTVGNPENNINTNEVHVGVYISLFLLCILSVLRIVEWYIVTLVVLAVTAIIDRRVFRKTDYSLLLTFIAFFIFIGNMGQIDAIRKFLSSLIEGRELLVSIVSSQVVSNVPAALLLSGFTSDYRQLIIGTNLGGLGTLIASMASLISYKQVVNEYPDKKGKYFKCFTALNIGFLVILMAIALFCQW